VFAKYLRQQTNKQTNNYAPQKFVTVYIFCTYRNTFLPAVSCGCETWFLTPGEEQRLRVLEREQGAEGDLGLRGRK
jgi:hypothetical protein